MTGPERADLEIALREIRSLRDSVEVGFNALRLEIEGVKVRVGSMESAGAVTAAVTMERKTVRDNAEKRNYALIGLVSGIIGAVISAVAPFVLKALGL